MIIDYHKFFVGVGCTERIFNFPFVNQINIYVFISTNINVTSPHCINYTYSYIIQLFTTKLFSTE